MADAPTPTAGASADPVERLRERRQGALWTLGVGIAMMFLGSFSANLALGGLVMVVVGAAGAFWFSRKLRRHREDPWKDPEIDAWEREHFFAPETRGRGRR